MNLGDTFGQIDTKKGMSVIIEHTSANPIGPLHIGIIYLTNIREGMIGYPFSIHIQYLTLHLSCMLIQYISLGNLRNVILGSVLSNILKSVGYTVKQHFYVNDLGAQVGLTALGNTIRTIHPSISIHPY